MAPHSGDWLHALPISSCGLRLDDEAVRVAVGLRLGTNLCQPHQCPCGALVDARGTHGLACRRSAGRSARHSHINDIIWRALKRAGVPSTKEPSGLSRTDGKRPDGLTLIPWQNGRSLIWDATIADTLAASHLPHTSVTAGAAADLAADRRRRRSTPVWQQLTQLIPISCEDSWAIERQGSEFSQWSGSPYLLSDRRSQGGQFSSSEALYLSAAL